MRETDLTQAIDDLLARLGAHPALSDARQPSPTRPEPTPPPSAARDETRRWWIVPAVALACAPIAGFWAITPRIPPPSPVRAVPPAPPPVRPMPAPTVVERIAPTPARPVAATAHPLHHTVIRTRRASVSARLLNLRELNRVRQTASARIDLERAIAADAEVTRRLNLREQRLLARARRR